MSTSLYATLKSFSAQRLGGGSLSNKPSKQPVSADKTFITKLPTTTSCSSNNNNNNRTSLYMFQNYGSTELFDDDQDQDNAGNQHVIYGDYVPSQQNNNQQQQQQPLELYYHSISRSQSSGTVMIPRQQQQQFANEHHQFANHQSSASLIIHQQQQQQVAPAEVQHGPTFKTVTLPRLLSNTAARRPNTNPFLPDNVNNGVMQPSACFGLTLRAHVVMSPHPSMLARSRSSGIVGPAPLPVVLVFIDQITMSAHCTLQPGDQVVAVNGISVLSASSLDYVEQLIGQSGQSLTLTVSPVFESNTKTMNPAQTLIAQSILASSSSQLRKSDEENLDRHAVDGDYFDDASCHAVTLRRPAQQLQQLHQQVAAAASTLKPALKHAQNTRNDSNFEQQRVYDHVKADSNVNAGPTKQQHPPTVRPVSLYSDISSATQQIQNHHQPQQQQQQQQQQSLTPAAVKISSNYQRPAEIVQPSDLSHASQPTSIMKPQQQPQQQSSSQQQSQQPNSKLTAYVPPMASSARSQPTQQSLPQNFQQSQPQQSSSAPIMVQVNPQIMLTLNQQQSVGSGELTVNPKMLSQSQPADQLRIYLSIPTASANIPPSTHFEQKRQHPELTRQASLMVNEQASTPPTAPKMNPPQQQNELKPERAYFYLSEAAIDPNTIGRKGSLPNENYMQYQTQFQQQQPAANQSSSSASPASYISPGGCSSLDSTATLSSSSTANSAATAINKSLMVLPQVKPLTAAATAAAPQNTSSTSSGSSSHASTSSSSVNRRVSFLRATTAPNQIAQQQQQLQQQTDLTGDILGPMTNFNRDNYAAYQPNPHRASSYHPHWPSSSFDQATLSTMLANSSQHQLNQMIVNPAAAPHSLASAGLPGINTAAMQAASVKKLKKVLGAGTPDILHAKNLTQRYAELLPIATLKGNAQVKLVSCRHASSSTLSSSSMTPAAFVTWQPAFLAIVRRTLHIFLLSRPPGLFIPAEIALPLFAFSLDLTGSAACSQHQLTAVSTSTSSNSSLYNDQPLSTSQTSTSSGCVTNLMPAAAHGASSTKSSPNAAFAQTSAAHQSPYIVLKPSVVTGGFHEALALDWDPMAWEYWILIDSDQDQSIWIDCLQQVQRTASHPSRGDQSPRDTVAGQSLDIKSSAAHHGAPNRPSSNARFQKQRFENVVKDDLALSDSKSAQSDSTRRIIQDLKRWKMRLGGKNFKLFTPGSGSGGQGSSGASTSAGAKDDSGSGNSNSQGGSSSQGCDQNSSNSSKPLGIYLASCEPSTTNQYVPAVVELCVAVIEARGLDTVGVYRVPGNNAAVTALWETVVVHGIENVNADDSRWSDIHVVGSLLKSFFRKLSEPLFPYNVYRMLMSANRQTNGERRMLSLKRLIHQLPPHHYETLRFLAKHLQVVAANSSRNKMDVNNLAIVFGPTLVRGRLQSQPSIGGISAAAALNTAGLPAGDNTQTSAAMNELVKDTSDQCRIVQTIISHVDWFFAGWEADNQVPDDETSKTSPGNGQQAAQQAVFSHLNAAVGQTSSSTAHNATPTALAGQQPTAKETPSRSSLGVSPKDSSIVSNIFSAGRYFRRKSDNLAQINTQLPSGRPRVISQPQPPQSQTSSSSTSTSSYEAAKQRSQSLQTPAGGGSSQSVNSVHDPPMPFSGLHPHPPLHASGPPYLPSSSSMGSATSFELLHNSQRAISEDDETAQDRIDQRHTQLPQLRSQRETPADGLYSATLTYIDPTPQVQPVVGSAQTDGQQPPSPPTSTHIRASRRHPPSVSSQQQQQGDLGTPPTSASALPPQILPPSAFMVRSLSLDSIDVFSPLTNPCNAANQQQHQQQQHHELSHHSGMEPARSEAHLADGVFYDRIGHVVVGDQPLIVAEEAPLERLAKLEQYLSRLATAEDESFKEAQKFGTQRLRLQAEYERLRADMLAQQLAQVQHKAPTSQARF